MQKDWNIRLKQAREKAGILLKEVDSPNKVGISQQSVIKYEKGDIFPQINILEKMCQCYHVTIEWIMYGDEDFSSVTRKGNYLYLLFSLIHSNNIEKIKLNGQSTYYVKNKKLIKQMDILSVFNDNVRLSSRSDYIALIEGIEKIAKDNV